ncbi:MAG: S-adenosylmethionine:tRNA ribosyltransferase-isomerase [Bacteroidia bacterium]|jgi:S-adenosylmethionine:tRNA ribosyltransferase-isomerase|nr:S-adenosylmethionine:tRNA ribosyltransferase-isomerase [Bacteroidia bacterium]GIV23393.1 MAG: S-adenosylmethionine:tRNA ribosyltransferase-isomerase [Bacteroidia bacterium]
MLWSYELPEERIAQEPIEPRHTARLLLYKRGEIQETIFLRLAAFLPENTLLLYNDSRVVPARLRQAKKEFLLTELTEGGWAKGSPQRWKGLFRPARFWRKGGQLTWETPTLTLTLAWEGPANDREGYFRAEWVPAQLPALTVLELVGEPPLPPYIRRSPTDVDRQRYQTFYARTPGSVAAPTAGLHFTPEVWERLHERGIRTVPLTLHVGLGTFLPLQNPEAPETHPMHAEYFFVPEATIQALRTQEGPIVCVGTTSLRTVESLYWLGTLALQGKPNAYLPALLWQGAEALPPPKEALTALPAPLQGQTQLYILPGYPFQLVDGLITNFHQPQSTLLGLVEAFIGREGIQQVYSYALEKGFRFLSYGDTSLLWRT